MIHLIPPFLTPVKDLVSPVVLDLTAPIKSSCIDLMKSSRNLQDPDACKKFLRTIARVILAIGAFFIYKAAWAKGVRYLGLLGGIGTFCILYVIGNKIDPHANYTGTTSWFLYEGILGLLRSWGGSSSALLCLLLVREKKPSQSAQGLLEPYIDRIASFFSRYPEKKLSQA